MRACERLLPRAMGCTTRLCTGKQARTFTALCRSATARSLRQILPGVSIPARTFITDSKDVDTTSRAVPRFAFAFDIDGVLLHVAKPIPGATETLKYLQRHNIPFILLTNGGGKHERERVADLSERLGVPLSTDNFVQSHTPFEKLVNHSLFDITQNGVWDAKAAGAGLADKTILVTGSDPAKSRLIAEAYGFRSVVTPTDILAAYPDVFPFERFVVSQYASATRPLPTTFSSRSKGLLPLKISAIFVFNDPRDWALDMQLITDLLLSKKGYLGTYSEKNGRAEFPNHGWQGDGQPHLYFSNNDLFWSAAYHLPRLGQGAFQAALVGIWYKITGGKAKLRRTTIGKPYARTYDYAEGVLARWRAKMLEDNKHLSTSEGGGSEGGSDSVSSDDGVVQPEPLTRVYMIGDNPESDIRGANEYATKTKSKSGTDWASILVRTGVWNKERDGDPKYEPRVIVDDVKSAVEWALEQEGWRR
ncbi:HAD-superfamily subfamily IIA hydrolase [Nemania sp. FL0916]|nr:HAD-superfamily subfamily IIA hydrolase [Nemania sp. FL0916]